MRIKIYCINETNKRIDFIGKKTEELKNDLENSDDFIAEIEVDDATDLFRKTIKVGNDIYSPCYRTLSHGEVDYFIVEQIHMNGEVDDETFENDLTCPVCGYVDQDCFEYSRNSEEHWDCPNCKSILSWEREYSVTYNAKVKSIAKPYEVTKC